MKMAPSTGKRKRDSKDAASQETQRPTTLKIVTGSYERVLHGFTATLPEANTMNLEALFKDSFLLTAHTSAVRCLAFSPPSQTQGSQPSKRYLASGGTDERVNLYKLSTDAPAPENLSLVPQNSAASPEATPTSRNNEIGSLVHHSSTVTCLHFPTRSNLLSSALDNTVTVTRTRDWTALSTIKAPIPKAVGRPSGDTAAPGEVPAGINHFAVHPSLKLMLTVGKGERCMRLWNLLTGKKAGVLTFDKELLKMVGEGKYPGSGEGQRLCWDEEGEEFAVAFDRGAVVYGLDCQAKGVVKPTPTVKIHQMRYLQFWPVAGRVLALSTDDGRILFYRTGFAAANTDSLPSPPATPANEVRGSDIPHCPAIAQLGGEVTSSSHSRIKDFEILYFPSSAPNARIVTASSDGAVRVWSLDTIELSALLEEGLAAHKKVKSAIASDDADGSTHTNGSPQGSTGLPQVGKLLGTYETGNRLTCLAAFVMEDPVSEEPPAEPAIQERQGKENEVKEVDDRENEDEEDVPTEVNLEDYEDEWGGLDEEDEWHSAVE